MEGDRKVTRTISSYNLDMIISIGYRVKSHIGIEFRKWATKTLKDYLLRGYALNVQLLQIEQNKVALLETQLSNIIEESIHNQKKITDGFLSIIEHYSRSFHLLDRYDTDNLSIDNLNGNIIYVINQKEVRQAIMGLKGRLIEKGEANDLFGLEKDDSLDGILGSISQTVFGQLAYPSIAGRSTFVLSY